DDSSRGEQLRERCPVRGALADRLVVEDDSADELLDTLRREQQLTVGATRILGRLDADRVEALLDRARGLVGGENPLPVGDERLRGLVQLRSSHDLPPCPRVRRKYPCYGSASVCRSCGVPRGRSSGVPRSCKARFRRSLVLAHSFGDFGGLRLRK